MALPRYAQNASTAPVNMNGGSGLGFSPGLLGGGIGGILSGLFGDSGAPYKDASKQYQKYFQGAQQFQNPFFNAGQQATDNFQNWLQGQQDPSAFINKLMGGYQESPWAKNLQQQSLRASQNLGSANGLTGSTPMQLQAQQNAGNISSQDQNQWLQNVLGVNSNYGAGQQSLMQGGQGAANILSQLFGNAGSDMSQLKYNQRAGEQQDQSRMFGGIGSILASLFGL
jgi:hypothetical protein